MRDPAARVFESHDPPAKAVACADDVVRLRPYVEAVDADRAVAWYQDPEVLAGSEGPGTPPFDRERVLRMYRFLESIGELFMIEVRSDSGWVLVGDVTLAPATLPIVIGEKAYRHQGVATRVLTLLIQRAKERGLSSLQAKHIWIENVASRRLFARAGFEEVEVGTDTQGRSFVRMRLPLSAPHAAAGSDPYARSDRALPGRSAGGSWT